jgi:hypothetical protein
MLECGLGILDRKKIKRAAKNFAALNLNSEIGLHSHSHAALFVLDVGDLGFGGEHTPVTSLTLDQHYG